MKKTTHAITASLPVSLPAAARPVHPPASASNHINEALRQWVRQYGLRTALVDGSQRLSYAQLAHRVEHLAAALQRLPLLPGERALVQLPNSLGFVIVNLALMQIGVIPVLAMPSQRAQEIDAICSAATPAAYFIADQIGNEDCRPLADSILRGHPCLRWVLVDGDPGPRGLPFQALDALEALDASEHPQAAHHAALSAVSAANDEVALLLLSGGSTGTPKLIPRTHADYLYNFTASAQLCGLDTSTVYLAVLPVAHNFTLACPGILGTLASGGTVILCASANCEDAMPLIARERVTHLALVPALARLWLEARAWERSDLSSLKLLQVGGAPLDAALARRLAQTFGATLQQVFGMAEGLLCYTRLNDPAEIIATTQGRPLSPLDLLRIVNEQGQEVAPGNCGELLVRGPYTIRAYYGDIEHNATSFTADGYYRTGDLVRMDASGNLIVQGRRKEQINRAGEKISALVIETQLKAIDGILDAVVLAVPDPVLGERICAFLQLVAGHSGFSREQILQALSARGLGQLPDQFETIAHWPLTAVGKIDRQQLLRLAQRVHQIPLQRYAEQQLTVHSQPLELAVRIMRALPTQHCMLYEQAEQWRIGIDAAMTVVVDPDGTVRRSDGKHWQRDSSADALACAMSGLPFADWCAYGRADFEYAYLGYDIPTEPSGQPLMKLSIPCSEIRISPGTVLLRSLDASALAALQLLVQEQDAQPTAAAEQARPLAREPVVANSHASQCYQQQVAAAVREMQGQAYQKVILSRQQEVSPALDMITSYRQGRHENTPARSFLLREGVFQAFGFCPETLLEVAADGQFSTQPLAGTRALCGDPVQDARLRQELLQDAKEIAEHAVSVKLAMDEMASISQPDSLGVTEFMQVCQRGSVQHLASRVRGRLAQHCTAWTAFERLFPAVTACGIPKRQAIDSIRRHERQRRGLYSGCVILVDSRGQFDAALVLRSVFHDGQRCWLQAGAGIMALSTPQREWTETCEKLDSVARHLQLASGAAAPACRPAAPVAHSVP